MFAGNQHAGNPQPPPVPHSWGFTYSVFFDGNAFHEAGAAAPPSLTVDTTNSACSSFSTTIDGVLTPLAATEYDVAADLVADGGFTLTPAATANEVTEGLSVLPSVNAPMLTYRGVADEQQGNSWTLSFSNNGGAVAELVCVKEDDTSFSGDCDVSTTPPETST